VTQLSLLAEVARTDRPWKVVRRVSRQVYAQLRAGGYVNRQTVKVLTALAWYRNSKMVWPTAAELARFMHERKRNQRDDPRVVAPRLTEMVRGRVVTVHTGQKLRIGGGVLTYLPLRRCAVTQTSAHPVAIREAGSLERQVTS
jgi:hypothetical protein